MSHQDISVSAHTWHSTHWRKCFHSRCAVCMIACNRICPLQIERWWKLMTVQIRQVVSASYCGELSLIGMWALCHRGYSWPWVGGSGGAKTDQMTSKELGKREAHWKKVNQLKSKLHFKDWRKRQKKTFILAIIIIFVWRVLLVTICHRVWSFNLWPTSIFWFSVIRA